MSILPPAIRLDVVALIDGQVFMSVDYGYFSGLLANIFLPRRRLSVYKVIRA
jgi:hypothetical protein